MAILAKLRRNRQYKPNEQSSRRLAAIRRCDNLKGSIEVKKLRVAGDCGTVTYLQRSKLSVEHIMLTSMQTPSWLICHDPSDRSQRFLQSWTHQKVQFCSSCWIALFQKERTYSTPSRSGCRGNFKQQQTFAEVGWHHCAVVVAFDQESQVVAEDEKIRICNHTYDMLVNTVRFPPLDTIGTGMAHHHRVCLTQAMLHSIPRIEVEYPYVWNSELISIFSLQESTQSMTLRQVILEGYMCADSVNAYYLDQRDI